MSELEVVHSIALTPLEIDFRILLTITIDFSYFGEMIILENRIECL